MFTMKDIQTYHKELVAKIAVISSLCSLAPPLKATYIARGSLPQSNANKTETSILHELVLIFSI